MTEPVPISIADVKRRFADVLGEVRYHKQRFIIERNGTPVAALVPLEELAEPTSGRRGFLALVGAFDDVPEFSAALDDAVASRRDQKTRPAPLLGT